MNPGNQSFRIRRATEDDAEALVSVLQRVASERVYTAIHIPWTADEQRRHIHSLSPRETIHVAESASGEICGYQTLDLWAGSVPSMSHAGQLGTYLVPEARGQRLGRVLFTHTCAFAALHGYAKFVIQVRETNLLAQKFYQGLGFQPCGRLRRQVRIESAEEDEILMEFFL